MKKLIIGKLYEMHGKPVRLRAVYENGLGCAKALLPLFSSCGKRIICGAPQWEDIDLKKLKPIDRYRESDYLTRNERNMKRLFEWKENRTKLKSRGVLKTRKPELIQWNEYAERYYMLDGLRIGSAFKLN